MAQKRSQPFGLAPFTATVALLLAAPAFATKGSVKLLVPHGSNAPLAGATLIADYGAFALYRTNESEADGILAAAPQGVRRLDETLEFDAQHFDPNRETPLAPAGFGAPDGSGPALSLVQFVGPLRDAWLAAVRATGAMPIHYVANQGYLVWADGAQRAALASMAAAGDVLQYSARLPAWFKLGPTLRERFGEKAPPLDGEARIPVVVQMVRHEHHEIAEEEIGRLLTRVDSAWTPLLAYQNVVGEMRLRDVAALAARGDVVHVGERLPRELDDEVQDQIVAGNFNFDQSGPSGPGYLTFLQGLGFPSTPASYPIVDVTDDGIGNGTVASNDPTFHEGGQLANPTRLAYVANCTNSASGEGVDGHGHINTSIVGGYDTRSGFPFQDLDTFQRGMGINPFGRLGGHRIFDPGFDQSSCGGTDTGVLQAVWQAGARINSNSWGCSGCAGTYDDSSQAYDVGVRDADLGAAGNQELIVVFSAGNSGPSAGTVGTPGNGKNMITVGASENNRPSDEDGNWTDGCLVGPTGADDAMDVIDFSSRGPSPGNRKKPEVIAPGTHIQGTASTNAGYTGNSVCDPFRPGSQTTFAASSGTSHSCPAVAGVASLVYYWLENGLAVNAPTSLTPPSPAMVKAYMMAHPTYLTGVGANDTLPSNTQGYGMPNLGAMFDDASKYLLDQTELLDNTGQQWTWIGAVADSAKPVRIALAYTDQAGAIGTSPQVNNLDLMAEVDGSTYLGNVFSGEWSTTGGAADAANNYEAVFLPVGTGGAISLTVTATNIAGDGVPNLGDATDQDFAIVCYNCVQEPVFTLGVTPASQSICAPADAQYSVNVGSVLGFSDSVTLSAGGNPAGTTVGFTTNPVAPPGASTLTLGNTGAATAGSYSIEVVGVSVTQTRSRFVDLHLYSSTPGTSTLVAPANGATNVSQRPTFDWIPASQAASYLLEVDDDPGFATPIYSQVVTSDSHVPTSDLPSNTVLYWRVRSTNTCGDGNFSATFSFTTVALPGDCSLGSVAYPSFMTSFENGTAGWTHSAAVGTDTWALSGVRTHTGANAWLGVDIATVSDQRLVSPAMALPNAPVVNLMFWNHQTIEDRTGGCFDGGILEISDNGGTTWTQIVAPDLLTDPYDGPISASFSNPLANLNAWCGDPQDWTRSVIDVTAWAGASVQFRFRLGTDSSVSREGWYLDDVTLQSCIGDGIFADGFEPGNFSRWSETVPAP